MNLDIGIAFSFEPLHCALCKFVDEFDPACARSRRPARPRTVRQSPSSRRSSAGTAASHVVAIMACAATCFCGSCLKKVRMFYPMMNAVGRRRRPHRHRIRTGLFEPILGCGKTKFSVQRQRGRNDLGDLTTPGASRVSLDPTKAQLAIVRAVSLNRGEWWLRAVEVMKPRCRWRTPSAEQDPTSRPQSNGHSRQRLCNRCLAAATHLT